VTTTAPATNQRAFGRTFVLVVASGFAYFLSLGILAPVLPKYVEEVLRGETWQYGLPVAVFAVSAGVLRPWVSSVSDRRGRRILVVAGCAVAAGSMLGYGLPGGLAVLLLMRLVTGAGEAAVFVGGATTAQDLAPAHRRGEAASYFSIAVYGGTGAGAPLGVWLYTQHGAQAAWTAAAVACAVGGVLGLWLPKRAPAPARPTATSALATARGLRKYLHPAAIRPGSVLLLSAFGYAGFSTFIPVLVSDAMTGRILTEYAMFILAVRIFGRRLPDRLGPRRGPLIALACQAVGLTLLTLTQDAPLVYVSTAVFASGTSLLYPALFPVVVAGAPEAERSRAIGTFTMFFDLSQGFGASLLSVIADLTEKRFAFLAAGVAAAGGFVLHRAADVPDHLVDVDEAPYPPPEPGE
jgi:MFS family permease